MGVIIIDCATSIEIDNIITRKTQHANIGIDNISTFKYNMLCTSRQASLKLGDFVHLARPGPSRLLASCILLGHSLKLGYQNMLRASHQVTVR